MKSLLSSIDLVIECRDYRVPLTSRNPLFEGSLREKERIIVYTKRDLGGSETGGVKVGLASTLSTADREWSALEYYVY